MAKRKKTTQTRADETAKPIDEPKASIWAQKKTHLILLAILSIVLYANTLTHDYTQDDAIVIYDNEFTTEGAAGIPNLLSYDTFRGFFKVDGKEKLVQGGRYRPLTPIMFALEYQVFGRSPMAGHLFNILWYALLVIVLYLVLEQLFLQREQTSKLAFMILAASIIFAIHPTHTEAIANIKGRDEIITLLGCLLTLYYTFKAFDSQEKKYSIYAGIYFFLAFMSKENTITFLAVIPLALYTFRNASSSKSLMATIPAFLATVAFIALRTYVIGFDTGGTPTELMNNPFLEWTGSGYKALSKMESLPTMIYCLGKYLGLLIMPHPLTHDYYPRHIDIMSWGDISVLLSLVLYLAMGIYAIIKLKSRSVISFCIIYFLATISIVSNIVFPIGTNMSERFLFMPSVGFALLVAYLGYQAYDKYPAVLKSIFAIAVIGMIGKTITRNTVWKDDYTLFTTDVHTSTRSAKLLNAAGGTKVNRAFKLPDGNKKNRLLDEAKIHLDQALEIHPSYTNAMLLNGNANFYRKDYDEAIKNYEKILAINPNHTDGIKNLAIALRDGGRYYGEQKQDINTGKKYLLRSLTMAPMDIETLRLLGITYGVSGDQDNAIKYFLKIAEVAPDNSGAYVNLFNAYMNKGDTDLANMYKNKALKIDPKAFDLK